MNARAAPSQGGGVSHSGGFKGFSGTLPFVCYLITHPCSPSPYQRGAHFIAGSKMNRVLPRFASRFSSEGRPLIAEVTNWPFGTACCSGDRVTIYSQSYSIIEKLQVYQEYQVDA